MSRRWKVFVIVGVLSGVADQITKIIAKAWLPTVQTPNGTFGTPVPVIENFFDWRLSFNPGASFGLFNDTSGARVFLSLIGLVAIGAILWMLHKSRNDQTRLHVALGLVAGGAIGNLVDRIAHGVVTDFIVWKYYDTEWPTFNVADAALVIGVGLLLLDMFKGAGDEAAEIAEATQGQAKKPVNKPPGKRRGGKR